MLLHRCFIGDLATSDAGTEIYMRIRLFARLGVCARLARRRPYVSNPGPDGADLLAAGGALLLGGPHDGAGGQECGFAAVGCIDGQVGGAAQHHQRKPAVGRIRNDQQVSGSILAVDAHYVLAFVFPSLPVELGWSL